MKNTLLLLVLTALYGCAGSSDMQSPIRLSLEQLGAESETRRTEQGLDVRTAISVSGLGLPTVAGQTVMSPGGELPDLIAVPVAGCSRLVVTEYETDATEADVANIKTKLDELQELSVRLVVLQNKQQWLAANKLAESQSSGGVTASTDAEEKQTTADLNTAFASVQATLTSIRSLSAKYGVVIARWSSASERTAKGSLGDIFGSASNKKDSKVGFVVMAGIRDASLQIGADLITRLSVEHEDVGASIDVENILNPPYVETFSRTAKYAVYSEQADLSKAFSAELKLTPEQLASFGSAASLKALLLQQQANFAYISSAILSASNQGNIGKSKTKIFPYTFWPRAARSISTEMEQLRRNDDSGRKTIYSNRVTLIALQKKLEGVDPKLISRAKNDSSCWYVVPKEGSYDEVGVYGARKVLCRPKGDYSDTHWREWKPNPKQCIDMSADLLDRFK